MTLKDDDDFGVVPCALTADDRTCPVFGVFSYGTCLCRTFRGRGCFRQFDARFYRRNQLRWTRTDRLRLGSEERPEKTFLDRPRRHGGRWRTRLRGCGRGRYFPWRRVV